MTTRASIVIVSYNARDDLARCLTSVAAETRADDEVIVVDNASADGTVRMLRERFPGVGLIENRSNQGFARGCNQGASIAGGRCLVFLNQDTEVAAGWLDGLLTAVGEEGPDALATSQLLQMALPDLILACGQDVHYTGLSFAHAFGAPAASCREPAVVGAVHGASFAIRRAVWAELAGMDEAMFLYYEETDLCWRAQLAGYRCLYAPASVVRHAHQTARPTFTRLYYSKRNRWVMLLKNWGAGTMLALLPGLLLAELADWAHSILLGGVAIRAKVMGYRWLAAHMGQVMRARGPVQARRRVHDATILRYRTATIRPREVTAGPAGAALAAAANLVFAANYRLVRWALGLTG